MKSLVAHMLFESDVFFVPVGYVFTTDRNTEFYKSTEGWKNQLTDKAVASKMEERLEMAATEEIKKYNTEHPEGQIGDAYTDSEGVAYYYTGDDFVSRDGVSLDPELSDKALRSIAKQNKTTKPPKGQKPTDPVKPTTDAPPAGHVSGKTNKPPVAVNGRQAVVNKKQPSPAPERPETKPTPRRTAKPTAVQNSKQTPPKTDTKPTEVDINISDDLKKLVSSIKNHPERTKIKALLQNGDEVSLLAADIIMSGKNDEAKTLIQKRIGAQ
jgi:outer membrane biosynthesis protein TonB